MDRHNGNGDSVGGLSYPIVVHCHLQWEWVWQRPQQIFSRLIKNHRVLFVETLPPSHDLQSPRIRRHHPVHDNLIGAQVQFPCSCWGDGAFVDRERRRLVQDLLSGPLLGKFEAPVQWFYDPMAVTAFAGYLGESAIVYDCMDELSKFKFAPPEIIQRERKLLSIADVVFTGGRKMFEAKQPYNPNCHFYGCGVEVEHFEKAMSGKLPLPEDLRSIPAPRLGYVGVVDERIDYELVAALADANAGWHVVMVGPVTKVDPNALPRRKNLHWLGGRKYEELPNYLKGFSVCLMPFALNEATEFINPTKALEYMATGRPVVSTAIADVVTNFPPVSIANSGAEFIRLCHEAVESPSQERIRAGLKLASENTWDSIVARMDDHIETALARKAGRQFLYEAHLDLIHRGGLIPLSEPAAF
jgi:glycosyltransferase involved in cell wall biosynthesis